jgi:hypothetical protein
MSPQFVFEAGPQRVEGRDAFLAGGGWPEGATTTMVAEAYDGEHAFQLYAAVNGMARIRSVEHLVVRDGAIATSEIVGDLAAFQAFMAAG